MNREELEAKLAEQRQRRQAANPSPALSSSRPHLSAWSRFVWTMIAVVILSFGAYAWAMMSFARSLDASAAHAEASPFSAITAQAASPSATVTDPASRQMMVCVNVPNGRLNVRFNPGENSDVRGYLAEGEIIQVVLVKGQMEIETVQDGNWLFVLSPVEGWANAAYICKQ